MPVILSATLDLNLYATNQSIRGARKRTGAPGNGFSTFAEASADGLAMTASPIGSKGRNVERGTPTIRVNIQTPCQPRGAACPRSQQCEGGSR